MARYSEEIEVPIVYYEKKDGLSIEYPEDLLEQ